MAMKNQKQSSKSEQASKRAGASVKNTGATNCGSTNRKDCNMSDTSKTAKKSSGAKSYK